ncbi:hypothetical protein O6H91_14G035700 [Diphasiastrum complanatum]|uniref:Uncharacterized protein n=1 Tax=Diphasiastrum complanatum TaxID=34168 RepID=A0ACC2BNC0_DIPCM|nr:hypothetical protein O6H91_14G035700 [Diphasiastrum complanatum]
MLDSNGDSAKRHSNFRNRPANRRYFRDRLDKPPSNHTNDTVDRLSHAGNGFGEIPSSINHADVISPGNLKESVTCETDGFSSSEAKRLMKDRWVAVINSCNDPSLDESERPVVHSSLEETPSQRPVPALQVSINEALGDTGLTVGRPNAAKTTHLRF